jgi:hypothetical protein
LFASNRVLGSDLCFNVDENIESHSEGNEAMANRDGDDSNLSHF